MTKRICGIFILIAMVCNAEMYSKTKYHSSAMSAVLAGVGARISLVSPELFDVGFGLGAFADVELLNYLHLVPSIEYCHAGYTYTYYPWSVPTYPYPNYPYHALNEFAVNGDARFYFSLNTTAIRPYGGGGFAILIINEHWDYYYNNPSYSHTIIGAAANFFCGADFPSGNLTWNVEFRGKVGAGFNMFKLTGGLMFSL